MPAGQAFRQAAGAGDRILQGDAAIEAANEIGIDERGSRRAKLVHAMREICSLKRDFLRPARVESMNCRHGDRASTCTSDQNVAQSIRLPVLAESSDCASTGVAAHAE